MPSDNRKGQLSLRFDVLSSLACSRLAKDGVARVLETILHGQSWDLGVAWLAEDDYFRHVADSIRHRSLNECAVTTAFIEALRLRLRPARLSAEKDDACSCRPSEYSPDCVWKVEAARSGFETAIALPLSRGKVTYGAIELFCREPRKLDQASMNVLHEVASDLGSFLWSRRLETRARLRNERMDGARRIAKLAYWECSPATWRLRSAINMAEVLGLNPVSLPSTIEDYMLLAPEEERGLLQAALGDLQDPNIGSVELEHRIISAPGADERVVVIQATADFDLQGNMLSIAGTLQDITPYRRLEDHLRLAATAIDHAGDAIVIFDARGAIMSVNSAFTRITGYAESEVLGCQLDVVLNRPSGRHDESFYRRLLGRLRTFGQWKGELWARAKGGRSFAMLLSLSEIRDKQGRVSHHVGVFTDVSRQKEYKERLELLALHDSLTGLPNRALFLDRGQQALSVAERNGTRIGLVFVDLDLFKRVNDTYGHAVGDEVLRQAGNRMRDVMRDCDTVARLAGDEFVVLLTDVQSETACMAAAERLITAITRPYQLDGITVELGASLGIAISPQHGTDIRILLHRADQALYSIKRNDVRRFALWSPEMDGEGPLLTERPFLTDRVGLTGS